MCHANANTHTEWEDNYIYLDNNNQLARMVRSIFKELFKPVLLSLC